MRGVVPVTTDADIARWLDVDAQPMQQLLHLGQDRWQSLGNDPQLLLTWPPGISAGPHRITVHLGNDATSGPSLYLDIGSGWSESTCITLDRGVDGSSWTLLAWLPDNPAAARLDPLDHEGEFNFSGVTLERLGEAEALLVSLARRVDAAPAEAAVLVRSIRRHAIEHGVGSCWSELGFHGGHSTGASTMPYDAWIRAYDVLAPAQEAALRSRIARLPGRPLVSLLLPVAEQPAEVVSACIDAVMAQLYPDWELLVLVDKGAGRDVLALLGDYAARSSRVRVEVRGDDESAAEYLRRIVSGFAGEFLGILEDGPILARHALLAHADAIVGNPGAGVLYADTDYIDADGRRVDPYFKPAWNPELFATQDYLNPVALYAADVVRSAGGLAGNDGISTVEDLGRRCIAALQPGRSIVHVPLMLCHAQASVADGRAGDETDCDGRLRGAGPPLPRSLPKVSLIVPTRDRVDLLRQCVESIGRSTYPDFEILIVDNQSSKPETLEYLASVADHGNVRVLVYDAPFNYSAINNFAVEHADADIVGLVNNDIEVITPDWLEQMVRHVVRPEVGAVGAMLYYPDDTIQHAGVVVGLGGVAGHAYAHSPRGTMGQHGRVSRVQSMTAVTAACLLVRRNVYREMGGLDEDLAVAFNDVDFCLRLVERGYRNVWTPLAELYHHESASRGIEDTPEKQSRFRAEVEAMRHRWRHRLDSDDAYHPALSLELGRAFHLADPPRWSLVHLVDSFASSQPDEAVFQGPDAPAPSCRWRAIRTASEMIASRELNVPRKSNVK